MITQYLSKTVAEQVKDFSIARSLIQAELTGIFGSETMQDLNEILALYQIYEEGTKFDVEGGGDGDYIPAQHRFKTIKSLIDKEARFLFSVPPTITIEDSEPDGNTSRIAPNQFLVKEVLDKNHFFSKLVRAAKDCLIGKRIAIAVDFNDKGINISLMPSLEFIYETDPADVDVITKFIRFYSVVENEEKDQQRVYKKKWELNDAGKVVITEELYNGNGRLIETLMPETVTDFTEIPVWVIINGGLLGDPFGKSDVEVNIEDEEWYNKLSSKDFDSLRKGTDQIIWAMDVNPRATKNLSRAAGSFWDLSSDPAAEGKTGQVGALENNMSYASALDLTLNRLRASMHAQLDVPDTSSEALQGVISSGKTMKAIYWGLMVRCGEKMLDWIPALKNMVNCIIQGSRLYPDSRKVYMDDEVVDGYMIHIENSYPILEDEAEEKSTDMAEVGNKVMSRKAYLQKWRGLSDEQAEAELQQIVLEQSMFEDNSNYFPDMNGIFEKPTEEE